MADRTEIDAGLCDHAASRAPGSRVVLDNGPWVHLATETLRRADPLVVNHYEARDGCAGVRTDGP